MNSHSRSNGPDGPKNGLGNVGRNRCERHTNCRAIVCPLEPWKRNRKRRKGEALCFYLKEAQSAKGTKRTGSNVSSNPHAADEAREIASFVSRTYIKTRTGAQLRAAVDEAQR